MTKISALGLFVCALATTTQAQAHGSSLMADFQSTQTQIHSEQRHINASNTKLGKLRGALRLLAGHNKQLSTQIATDKTSLKAISIKLVAAQRLHHERSAALIVQQQRLQKGKNLLQSKRRHDAMLRDKLRRQNNAIKKATKFVKKELKKAQKIGSATIAKAKRALKRQEKRTKRAMKRVLGAKRAHGKHAKAVRKTRSHVRKARHALKKAMKKASKKPSKAHKMAVHAAKKNLKKAKHAAHKAKKALKKHIAKKAKKATHKKKAVKKAPVKKHHSKKLAQVSAGQTTAQIDALIDSI